MKNGIHSVLRDEVPEIWAFLLSGWGESGIAILNEALLSTM